MFCHKNRSVFATAKNQQTNKTREKRVDTNGLKYGLNTLEMAKKKFDFFFHETKAHKSNMYCFHDTNNVASAM